MGFFDRFYYGKAGKRDYSEMDMPKTRLSLFFLVLRDHVLDLVKVNLLQVIFWLPFLLWTIFNLMVILSFDVQTLLAEEGGAAELVSSIMGCLVIWLIGIIPCVAITGPSSAGAAYIMRNWARDQHAFLFSDFKDAFKSNWKQALAVSAISALVPALVYTGTSYYGQMANSNVLMIVPMVIVISATLLWTLMLPLLYSMMIGYELRFIDLLRNAFLMAVACLPQAVLARLITLIPIVALVLGLYFGNGIVLVVVSLYYLLVGFALSKLIYASIANSIFDKYLNSRIEGASVNLGLRPQNDDDEDDDEEDDDDDDDDDE